MFGVPVSHGVLNTWVAAAAKTLRAQGFETALVNALKASGLVHADETPIGLDGKVTFVQVISVRSDQRTVTGISFTALSLSPDRLRKRITGYGTIRVAMNGAVVLR